MSYTQFAGKDAHSDAKASFSQALDSLESRYRENRERAAAKGLLGPSRSHVEMLDAIGGESIYTEAKRLMLEIEQYKGKFNEWDSSWAPLTLGGWFSSADIRKRLDSILWDTKPIAKRAPVIKAVDVTRHPVSPPIEAQGCETADGRKEAAKRMFGPIIGNSAIAQTFACNKTKIMIVGGVIGLLLVLALLQPYVSLASRIV